MQPPNSSLQQSPLLVEIASYQEQDGFRFRAFPDVEGWRGNTVRQFETRDGAASIFVTREMLPPNETLDSYCSKKLISVCKAPGFDLVESNSMEVSGLRGARKHRCALRS